MRKTWDARVCGLVAAVIVAAVVLYTLFAQPALSVIADGSYQASMDALKLSHTEAELARSDDAAHPIETFVCDNFDFSTPFTRCQSLRTYAAMPVRLIAQCTGQPFTTQALACVYTFVIALGAYLTVSALYDRTRTGAIAAGCALAGLYMQACVTAYLNSLYNIGAVLAGLTLYVGCLTNALCAPRGAPSRYAVSVILSGGMLLCAQTQLLVLVPFVLIGALLAVAHGWPSGRRFVVHAVLCVLALLFVGRGAFITYTTDPDISSDPANYLAIFQGYLPAAEEPEDVLAAFGLDESYAADMGRSYYEPEEAFVHNPRSEIERGTMMGAIRLSERIRFCRESPDIIAKKLDTLVTHLYDPMNGRVLAADGNERYVRPSPLAFIYLFLSQSGFATITTYMAVTAILCLILAFAMRSGRRKLMFSLFALFAGLTLYLPVSIVLTGGIDVDYIKVLFFFFGTAAEMGAVVAVVCGVNLFRHGLSEERSAPPPEPVYMPESGARPRRAGIRGAGLVWAALIVCVCLACALLLPQRHIGGVNNGDFGRMMEQIDIYWQKEQLDHSEQQLSFGVIEQYDYREPYHAERLTSADPTYSLVYPTALMRVITFVTGHPFDTRVIALITLAMSVAAILLILRDLTPLLGRGAVLLAAGLIAIYLGETNVAWYNSLFGESSFATGLIMTAACAVHLAVMPRGSKRSFLWLLLLAASARYMTCSKAQIALAVPFGVLLIAVFALYHRPQGRVRCIAFALVMTLAAGIVCYDTLGVYKKNAGISEQQTVWQSVFYGALMVADDPIAAMEDLGIDTKLAPDIGKDAYQPPESYVYPLDSQEAYDAFYSRVNTMTMVGYYLRHPADLMRMLDRAAQESVELPSGFIVYSGDVYGENPEAPYRFTLWRDLRSATACRAFWQYVLLYGLAILWCAYLLIRKDVAPRNKLFIAVFLCVMMIGVFQYPLSVVGNGFADNNKQLYGFMLCHDLLVVAAASMGVRAMERYVKFEGIRARTGTGERVAAQ